MVDRKSNILISINAILLSIILGTVIRQLDQDPHLIIPVILILLTNLTSIVYAVIATRPAKRHADTHTLSEERYKNNLLFYGDYSTISEEDYINGMNHLIDHGDELYDAISRDVYYTGKILQRKFGFLRTSFNVFMYGLILSVVAFVICYLFLKDTMSTL
jgi:MFS-type transporter involved in bile tolerance (Atg22 family)